jgi:hypothetical protein
MINPPLLEFEMRICYSYHQALILSSKWDRSGELLMDLELFPDLSLGYWPLIIFMAWFPNHSIIPDIIPDTVSAVSSGVFRIIFLE